MVAISNYCFDKLQLLRLRGPQFMKHIKIVSGVTLLLVVSACTTSPVVSIGNETYYVSSSSVPGATPAATKALLAAKKTCADQGKAVVVKTMSGRAAVLFHNEGNATVTFKCVNPNSSEYNSPTLRKDNGVSTIQIQTKK
jgi:hypothetical protein